MGLKKAATPMMTPRVVKTLRMVLLPRDAIQDTVQEVFLRAYKSLATCREPDRFKAWLASIAMNIRRPDTALKIPIYRGTPLTKAH